MKPTFFQKEDRTVEANLLELQIDIKEKRLSVTQFVEKYSEEAAFLNLLDDTDDIKTFLSLFSEHDNMKMKVMKNMSLSASLLSKILMDTDSFGQVLKYLNHEYHNHVIDYVLEHEEIYNRIIYNQETLELANSLAQRYGAGTPFKQPHYTAKNEILS